MQLTDQTSHDSHPCGNTGVANKPPIKLPEEFFYLNDKNKCLNPDSLEKETRQTSVIINTMTGTTKLQPQG